MFRFSLSVVLVGLVLASAAAAQEQSPPDRVKTSAGDLVITFIGHGSLLFTFGGRTIYVDP